MIVMPILITRLTVLFIENAEESDNIGITNTPCVHMIKREFCPIHVKGCVTNLGSKSFSKSFLNIEINPKEIKDAFIINKGKHPYSPIDIST